MNASDTELALELIGDLKKFMDDVLLDVLNDKSKNSHQRINMMKRYIELVERCDALPD